jgi:hypothetical protein
MKGPCKSLLPIAHINRLELEAYGLTATENVDFFLDFRHPPIHSARILQRHCGETGTVLFIIKMAKVCFLFSKYRN